MDTTTSVVRQQPPPPPQHQPELHNTNSTSNTSSSIDIHQILQQFESDGSTPRQLALLRIHLLSRDTTTTFDRNSVNDNKDHENQICGLAAMFVPILSKAVHNFIHYLRGVAGAGGTTVSTATRGRRRLTDDDDDYETQFKLHNGDEELYHPLHRLLSIYRQWVRIDSILAEELGRQGAHSLLIQLMNVSSTHNMLDDDNNNNNQNNHHHCNEMIYDAIVEIQDIAGEIAVTGRLNFPITTNPYTIDELLQRLPLSMTIPITTEITPFKNNGNDNHCQSDMTISSNGNDMDQNNETMNIHQGITVLIHQICSRQSAQVDVGFGESMFLPQPLFSFGYVFFGH